MAQYLNFISQAPDGKPQILKREALVTVRQGRLPASNEKYSDILKNMDAATRAIEPTISNGALANCHGDWYEWLLGIAAWNFTAENENADLAVLLPNKSSLDLADMYEGKLKEHIIDLRNKVDTSSGVKLITSNPDFMIIKKERVHEILGNLNKLSVLDANNIDLVAGIYKKFIGTCNFKDIVGYLSVKTSFRPDRRLQIAHEGSLMKAIYVHLQTREWIINPKGLKYSAMATKVSDADREALKTVATHSIVSVSSTPIPAVDAVYEVDTPYAANTAFTDLLI